jgi:Domain of unknown function (DUF1906)
MSSIGSGDNRRLRRSQHFRRGRTTRVLLGALIGTSLALSFLSASASAQASSSPASVALRTITYHGYRFEAPASWPVYRLAADPARCVLFNTHAVYLGTPGAHQHCPARAYGRSGSLLVQPLDSAAVPLGAVTLPDNTAALGTRTELPAHSAALASGNHLLRVAEPGPGVLVTASYGSDLHQMRGILASGRMTERPAAASTRRASQPGKTRPATRQAHGASAKAADTSRSASAARQSSPSSLVDVRGSGLGFDACTAPSVQTMSDWLASPYRVIGTYLGGDNWACDYGNFNTEWVQQVSAMGWRFIPIWVGPQAACSGITGAVTINPADAQAQGQAQAASAVATAASFGYGPGTPIYFDMEGYDSTNAPCVTAVLAFLAGWTQGLHAAGYLSGVYSSADSGIVDLASEYTNPSYPSPNDIWIADWTGDPVLTDPALPNSDWPHDQRLHQYYGAHNETWGGQTINIDNDVAAGDLAGAPAAQATARPVIGSVPDAVPVTQGGSGTVALVLHAARGQARSVPVRWQVTVPAGLTVTPSQGVTPVHPGRPAVVLLHVSASQGEVTGRYDMPVTARSGTSTLAETFELVTVLPTGGRTSTLAAPYPVVLYAADQASMSVAVQTARQLALPTSDITGNFEQAWNDVSTGNDLVLAVGRAATNALNQNPCGWTNPAGTGAGTTPFFYIGTPLTGPTFADVFEPSGGSSPALTALVTTQLMHYALAGTIPNDGGPPDGPSPPAEVCLGSPNVPVP